MKSLNYRWIAGTLLVSALAGCGAPSDAPRDGDAAPACADASTVAPDSTLEFVVRALTLDSPDARGSTDPAVPHAGFDLDGRFSTDLDAHGCNRADYFSALDSDQNSIPGCATASCGGVDNVLPDFAAAVQGLTPDFNVSASLAASITSGQRLLAVRLSHVDDLSDDPAVELTVLAVFDEDARCDNNLAGAGRFVADARSFEGGDPARPRWHARAAIVRGRVRTLEAFTSPVTVPLTLHRFVDVDGHDSQLRFDLPSCGTVTRGNWGAWVEVGPLVALASSDEPRMAEFYALLGESLTDIEVNGVCADATSSTRRYGGASVGYGFELAPAVVRGVAGTRPAGACGTPGDAGPSGG